MSVDVSTALYRFYDADDQLLYVGITHRLPRRVKEHIAKEWSKATSYIDVEWFETKTKALVAERKAIRSEHPRYNIMHNGKVNENVRVEGALADQNLLRTMILEAQRDGWSVRLIEVDDMADMNEC